LTLLLGLTVSLHVVLVILPSTDLLCLLLWCQALRTMGMTDGAYWASWGMWEVTLAFITGHLITIFGGVHRAGGIAAAGRSIANVQSQFPC
jgi:hypothetical protein